MAGYHATLYAGTDAERAIEPAVASLGVPYRFQHPYYLWGQVKFFPDFWLPTIGVILEVDDDSHYTDPEKKKADGIRTSALEKLGNVVVRCTNAEALRDPFGTVERLIRPHLGRIGPGIPLPPVKKPKKKKKKCSK